MIIIQLYYKKAYQNLLSFQVAISTEFLFKNLVHIFGCQPEARNLFKFSWVWATPPKVCSAPSATAAAEENRVKGSSCCLTWRLLFAFADAFFSHSNLLHLLELASDFGTTRSIAKGRGWIRQLSLPALRSNVAADVDVAATLLWHSH